MSERHEFQAEIRQLLDIVIHSLYTDKEIFIRELVSNAADACEKLRFLRSSGQEVHQPDIEPVIRIATDDTAGTISITDTGIGMTRDELVENLGTIAHSGSRAFLARVAESEEKPDASLIGQFGVGFYSSFMVAAEVRVWSRSHLLQEKGHAWSSDGQGAYRVESAPDWDRGTRVLVTLRPEEKEYSQASRVESILQRYSNFVPFPIELNGKRINTVTAVWMRNRNEVTEEEYREFYQFIGHDSQEPLGRLHFSADAPLAIHALLYVPARNLERMGLGKSESEVNLHCRRILIEPRAKELFPEWLRFLRGVVDSEDLPLNISRESMQDSALMQKLNKVITTRFLRHLEDLSRKDEKAFRAIHDEYRLFLKEGVITDPVHREKLSGLLRFESSALDPGRYTSLGDYVGRTADGQDRIYYLHAPSREAAEAHPSYEVLRARKLETLFLYEPLDELVMDNIGDLEGKRFCAADIAEVKLEEAPGDALSPEQAEGLTAWLKERFGEGIHEVRVSERLVESPALVRDSAPMSTNLRRILVSLGGESLKARLVLEINPRHEVIRGLHAVRERDEALAGEFARQILDNAALAAGVLTEPQSMVRRLNTLLGRVLSLEGLGGLQQRGDAGEQASGGPAVEHPVIEAEGESRPDPGKE